VAVTVGDTVISVPGPSSSAIHDLATGALIREEEGLVTAFGHLLTRIDPALFTAQAVLRAATGDVVPGVTAQPVFWLRDGEHPLPGDDVLASRTAADVMVFNMVDTTSGATRWTVEEGVPIAQSSDGVLVAVGSHVRLLERRTGEPVWTHSAPGLTFPSATFGNGVVIIVSAPGGD